MHCRFTSQKAFNKLMTRFVMGDMDAGDRAFRVVSVNRKASDELLMSCRGIQIREKVL